MKPFNLEQAKAGKPVQTRDGCDVEILKFDLRGEYPILAVIKLPDYDIVVNYPSDGIYHKRRPSNNYNDLLMKSEIKEGWVAVFNDGKSISTIYDTKEKAESIGGTYPNFVAAAKIVWEE